MMKRVMVSMMIFSLIAGVFAGCNPTSEQPPSGIVKQDGVYLITPVYPTDDVVVAEVIATDKEFGADPTGEKDSSDAIQKALFSLSETGGTVWLPVGKYRITRQIVIPAHVTLRGDWQDPDEGTDYGTVLLLDVPSEESNVGTFMLGGSSGLFGLTFYYPNQTLDQVKPYPFTAYVNGFGAGYMLQTVQNCTFINAYKAIGACVDDRQQPHEMLVLENIKGTALKVAAEMYNQADVGTMQFVEFSPRCWASAADWMNPPSESAIAAYTRKNAIGFLFGDLEWTQFSDIVLSDFETGIQTVKGTRCDFSAAMYNLSVTDCGTAFQADAMLGNWGTVIANSVFSGDNAFRNRAVGADIRLVDVTLDGTVRGQLKTYESKTEAMKDLPRRVAPKPKASLTVVTADKTGKTDVSEALQAALSEAGKQGGGVVYLPGGLYRLEKPVTVPAGVELRGASAVGTRDQRGNSAGTLFLLYPKAAATDEAALSETAFITLQGDRAGIRGVRFMDPQNITILSDDKHSELKPSAYVVRGQASDVYVINCAFEGVYNGIDFRGCNNHYIKRVVSAALNNMMFVGGEGGMVEDCLQNSNAMCRMGSLSEFVRSISEPTLKNYVFDPLTRVTTEYIRVDSGADETLVNVFSYGVKNTIVNLGGSLWAANVGGDTLGEGKPLLRAEGGTTTVINMMRANGISYQCAANAKLQILGRISHVELDTEDAMEFKNMK